MTRSCKPFLAFWLVFNSVVATSAAPAVPALKVDVKGLPGLDLDRWIDGFFWNREAAPAPRQALREILSADSRSSSAADFYRELLSRGLNRPYAAAEGYRALAEALLAARRARRPARRADGSVAAPNPQARQMSLLLETLAEETLYAAELRLPGPGPDDWLRVYERIEDGLCSSNDGTARTAVFSGIKFCAGDVLVSKDDALLSSFMSRRLQHPSPFSHSAVVSVEPGVKRPLRLFSSSGKDGGVKLREPVATYKDTVRLFVYRLRERNAQKRQALLRAAIAGTDHYGAEMRRRAGGDPARKAAFPFDFHTLPGDPQEQYCSEVADNVYKNGGLHGALNPYPKVLWSTFDGLNDGGGQADNFWRAGFGVQATTAHDPGDVEFNPNFDVAAALIRPKLLARERIDAAIADVAYAYLSHNVKGVRDRYTKLVSPFGDRGVTMQDVALLRRSGVFDGKTTAGIARRVFDNEENINLKLVVFFIAVNQTMGAPNPDSPRSRLIAAEARHFARTGRPLGLNALRTLAAAAADVGIDRFLKDWAERRGA